MLNIGVVGTGHFGKHHVRILSQMKNVTLKTICDINKEIGTQQAKIYGANFVPNYVDLINDTEIDCVFIVTPASLHFEQANRALLEGKHVFVEKPITCTSKEALILNGLAKSQNRRLMVGHIFRYEPLMRKLKEEITAATFGNINFASSTRYGLFPPRNDAGILLDLAIHDFDLIPDLLSKTPTAVSASAGAYLNAKIGKGKFEETAFATLYFPDGVLAQINVSWLLPRKVRTIWISGSKRGAIADSVRSELEIFDDGLYPEMTPTGHSRIGIRRSGSYKPFIRTDEPLQEELKHFLDCVENKRNPLTDALSGYQAVKIAEKALESFREQRVISLANEPYFSSSGG